MFFAKTIATLLAASSVAIASPVVARQDTPSPQPILDALATTRADLVKLNSTLNTLKPLNPINTLTALKIQTQANQIATDLQNSVKAANAINGKFSDDDSLTLASAVGALEPDITSTLNNIVTKKPYFKTAGLIVGDLSKTVEFDLKQERDLIGQFGAALTPHISDTYSFLGPALTSEVQALFDKAIAAYAKCTGLICLPPITLQPPKKTS